MSLATPDSRRSASGIPYIPLGPGIAPGSDHEDIRQQAGWGYSGLPVSIESFVSQALPDAHGRIAAAGVAFLPLGPAMPIPADSDTIQFKQQSAWGFCGLPVDVEAFVSQVLPDAHGRIAAAGIPFIPYGPAMIIPTDSAIIEFKQQSGWGFCGLPVQVFTAPTPTVEDLPFVYRPMRRRLRARKRRF